MPNKNQFIAAYTWMYGSTKKVAERIYKSAMECADYKYIREVVACFEDNARRSFYDD